MSSALHIQHLRIGRITVQAEPGADRHALQRALQQQLPDAIAARLQGGATRMDGSIATNPIAEAVAQRVAHHVNGTVPR